MMYNLSPRLFFISMSLPVPLSVVMAWIGVDRVRKLDRKISKVSDLAAAGTIDVLKEVTTVRQFAMEAKEQERYAVTNIFRRILEQRLDSVKRITWGTIDVPFVLMHIVVVYFGINECLKNVLTPAAVFNMTVFNWEVSWEVRYIVSDLLPSMVRMMEPLERLSAVLGSAPRIEPHPDKPRTMEGGAPLLKPKKFRGHIVFNDCHFRYPTEKQKPVLRGISFEVHRHPSHLWSSAAEQLTKVAACAGLGADCAARGAAPPRPGGSARGPAGCERRRTAHPNQAAVERRRGPRGRPAAGSADDGQGRRGVQAGLAAGGARRAAGGREPEPCGDGEPPRPARCG